MNTTFGENLRQRQIVRVGKKSSKRSLRNRQGTSIWPTWNFSSSLPHLARLEAWAAEMSNWLPTRWGACAARNEQRFGLGEDYRL